MMADDSTGGSHGLAGEIVSARLSYLCFNMSFIIMNLLIGYIVYERTKSLTIEVDYLSFSCECLAVAINISVELVKRNVPRAKSVLVLDLVGGLSSLSLLIGIGVFGLYNAISTTEELAEGHSSPPASHLEEMVQYSAFSLVLSIVNLFIFGWLKDRMLPEGGDCRDQLNMLSNLAHSIVDFVTNFAVLGTSLWLRYGVAEENWFEMRKHKVWVDVFGSFMVCACILVSICWLLRDVVQCVKWIREMPVEEDAPAESAVKTGASSGYGTMQGVGAKAEDA